MSRTALALQHAEKPHRVKPREVQEQLREISERVAARAKVAAKNTNAAQLEAEAFGGGKGVKREPR